MVKSNGKRDKRMAENRRTRKDYTVTIFLIKINIFS